MSAFYFTETTRSGERKRHKIVRHRGFDGYWVRWTQQCSGCAAMDGSNFGCHECGYTGKRRQEWFVPLDAEAWERQRKRVWERYQRLLRSRGDT